jgi:hypothetical protein
MKTFFFVLMATAFEATGDAVVRISLHTHNHIAVRLALFLTGAAALTLYGTSLNLAPVEFAQVTGIYIATLFVLFQITNFIFFRTAPTTSVIVGGILVIAGGLIVGLWR